MDEATTRNRDIGARMRKAREDAGLRQIELADACEVSRNAVSMWERGESGIEQQKLIDAARALRIDVVWLQWGKGERPGRKVNRSETQIAAMPDQVGISKATERSSAATDWWSIPAEVIDEFLMTKNKAIRVHRVAEQTIADVPLGSQLFIDSDTDQEALGDGDLVVVDAGVALLLKRVLNDMSSRTKIALVDDRIKTPQFVDRKRIKIAGKVIAVFRRP